MKREEVQLLEHGLYKIWWKSGGHSLAAVGSLSNGKRWMAPTNWITVPSTTHWPIVKKVKLIRRFAYGFFSMFH